MGEVRNGKKVRKVVKNATTNLEYPYKLWEGDFFICPDYKICYKM